MKTVSFLLLPSPHCSHTQETERLSEALEFLDALKNSLDGFLHSFTGVLFFFFLFLSLRLCCFCDFLQPSNFRATFVAQCERVECDDERTSDGSANATLLFINAQPSGLLTCPDLWSFWRPKDGSKQRQADNDKGGAGRAARDWVGIVILHLAAAAWGH